MRSAITPLLLSLLVIPVMAPVFAKESVSELMDLPPAELVDRQELAKQQNAVIDKLLGDVAPELAQPTAETAEDSLNPSTGKNRKSRSKQPSSTARAGESSKSRVPDSKPNPLMAEETLRAIKAKMTQGAPGPDIERKLSDLVAAHPEYAEARLLLGRAQVVQNDLDAALINLAHLLEPSNPDWQPWFWVASAYLAKDDLESAKQHLEQAIAKNSRVSALWIQLAVLYQELGEHSSALQYLQIAEQIDANNGLLHFNRAYSLEQLRRPAQARRAYQRFLISDIEPHAQDLRVIALQRIDTLSQSVEVANRE